MDEVPAPLPSTWLIGIRVRRLVFVLDAVPGGRMPASRRQVSRIGWLTGGGPYDEIAELLSLLARLGLVVLEEHTVRRTSAGNRVMRAARQGDLCALGEVLIRSGTFHDQARLLIGAATRDADGNLRCGAEQARKCAPQLLGVLSSWPGIRLRPSVFIPAALAKELNAIWALLPPEPEVPPWEAERKAVGNRAETYSHQLELERIGDASKLLWVARDDDGLGWDIEDRSLSPFRCIEVKGRRDANLVFYLSETEWSKAREVGPRYEVHFWGRIDLCRDAAEEYGLLRAAGYPTIVHDLAAQVQAGIWTMTPVKWRVERRS